MAYYFYINANDDHKIHTYHCKFFSPELDHLFLGVFDDCDLALIEAKKYYPQSKVCNYCNKSFHD
ncbi:hypothetical protein STH12_02472 [Shewanella khirikhana]|uniref:Uncharacterized protein n=1 Tax=Shewanella khirikhana TaxID=1965282 RepID=A0ABN5TZ81_9GAMM|nr:hypothetical protein STH12_02472 [Shewanella khirikhana]